MVTWQTTRSPAAVVAGFEIQEKLPQSKSSRSASFPGTKLPLTVSLLVENPSLSIESHSTTTRSLAERPKISGWYISSAFVGGTTKLPGVVARVT